MKKDELISGTELASRLKLSSAYITKQKQLGKLKGCMHGKRYYFNKSSLALGKDPNNPYETQQKLMQKKDTSIENDNLKVDEPKEEVKEPKKKTIKPKIQTQPKDENLEDKLKELESIEKQIKDAIEDSTNTSNTLLLNGLKTKTSILTEYQKSIGEKIKNKKLQENLYSKDEVVKILGTAVNMLRNGMINLANNYSVSLEGLSKQEIKEYVQEDINRLLEDFQDISRRFD